MPGPRMPLQVLEAMGNKHLSKTEKAERAASEVIVDSSKTVAPPKWLSGQTLRREFAQLEEKLRRVLPFCDLDADCLAHFLTAQDRWKKASAQAKKAMAGKEPDVELAKDWSAIEDRYFKQARACAGDLGLNITSRCRLVIPKGDGAVAQENPFERKMRERSERRNA